MAAEPRTDPPPGGDPLPALKRLLAQRSDALARQAVGGVSRVDALRHARTTLRLDAARVPPDSQWVSEDHLSLALALHALGHDDEARGEYLRAIEVREGKFGPRAPLMVPVLAEYE